MILVALILVGLVVFVSFDTSIDTSVPRPKVDRRPAESLPVK